MLMRQRSPKQFMKEVNHFQDYETVYDRCAWKWHCGAQNSRVERIKRNNAQLGRFDVSRFSSRTHSNICDVTAATHLFEYFHSTS
ncbi:hypothetical protein Y032_0788g2353 [Ancylostoma ceylanicum]|uniref:Uncharacterized protein n=1 Tax=Ancylostoma ceylanicum TaxID=53326 RepID=A0A016WDV5_9BILA|nr:hypothetical protein Y032_0788g2353 [Ancylostoma ceylanicum]